MRQQTIAGRIAQGWVGIIIIIIFLHASEIVSNKKWSMSDNGFQAIAVVAILAMRVSRLVTTTTAIR